MEISLIVPFHRGKNYLRDCLESIAVQEGVTFETILVLDHVEEEILDLLEEFEEKVSLKVLELEEERGTAAARNLGLQHAEGKYIYFLDADDYLLSGTIFALYQKAEQSGSDVVCGVMQKTWYKRMAFLEELEKQDKEEIKVQEEGEILDFYMDEAQTILGILCRRDLIGGMRFPELLTVYSDYPFFMELMDRAGSVSAETAGGYIKRFHNDPIKLPSLDQKQIPDRHIQFVKSFKLAKEACVRNEELQDRIEMHFFLHFIQLYEAQFLPGKGTLLPGTQFQVVCKAMQLCNRDLLKQFGKNERKLLEGFYEEREWKCILYANLSEGLTKFKKSRTKGTAIFRMIERFIFRKMPVKENWIVFESYLGKNYSDSCKYIYQYMDKNYGSKYKYIWVLRNPEKKIDGSAITVKYMSLKHFYYASRAKYWVNNMRQPVWRTKRKDQIFLETWHGTPLKRLVFDMEDVHSATATYKEDFYKQSRQWDYLLSDNPFSTSVFESAFLFPREKILELGYPRNDILHWDNKEEIGLKVKKQLGIPDDKKTILYAPTWRDDEYYEPGRYKFELALDLQKMREALSDEYVILLRTHYFIADKLDLSGYEGFAYNVSRYDDISELYLISDICITDYSSVFFDYANLRRPMLFYTYDLEKYRDILRGFYIDMEKEVPGPLLYTTEDIIDAILHIDEVEEDLSSRYQRFYQKYCCWDDGHASERIVESVFGVAADEEKDTSID